MARRFRSACDPVAVFRNHYVVFYDNKVYDPSYGEGPFMSQHEHENAAIDGIAVDDFVRPSSDTIDELLYTFNPGAQ